MCAHRSAGVHPHNCLGRQHVRVSEEQIGSHTALPGACALRSRGVHAGSHPGGASKDSFEWRRQGGYGGDAGVSRPPHLHAVLHDWAKTRRRF